MPSLAEHANIAKVVNAFVYGLEHHPALGMQVVQFGVQFVLNVYQLGTCL